MNSPTELVGLHVLERDERVDELQSRLLENLVGETGNTRLTQETKLAVNGVIKSLRRMRFESREDLERTTAGLLEAVAPQLASLIPIALEKAARCSERTKGVLVIYTGGTIGSAPKDLDDPESPQIVMPWKDLKNAAPQLGLLGYPVDAISFVAPLDSCNVGPEHWRTMAHVIHDHYRDYEGFVILHGTDSMVYTASALSFMLPALAKPVVVTGSQVAGIANPRNGAHQNMVTAIMLANPKAHGLPVIPEMVVSFGNLVSRGNRAKKMNVVGYQGFFSPNYLLLGEAGEFGSRSSANAPKRGSTTLPCLSSEVRRCPSRRPEPSRRHPAPGDPEQARGAGPHGTLPPARTPAEEGPEREGGDRSPRPLRGGPRPSIPRRPVRWYGGGPYMMDRDGVSYRVDISAQELIARSVIAKKLLVMHYES